MKNHTQVYVKNSIEAVKTYCKAFGVSGCYLLLITARFYILKISA